MPTFQLVGLDPQPFTHLFDLTDAQLRARNMRRVQADGDFGFPCRVSLADAQVDDELLLLPFEYQPAASPYRASGPIYVRRGARQARLVPGHVPPYIARRLISLRAYDGDDLIVAADVLDGNAVAARLTALFERLDVRYVHLHNARRGCFACAVMPVAVA